MNWFIPLMTLAISLWGCWKFSSYLHKEAAGVQPQHHQYEVLWPLYVVQVGILLVGIFVTLPFLDFSQFGSAFWREGWGGVLFLLTTLMFVYALDNINSHQAKKWGTVSMVGDW